MASFEIGGIEGLILSTEEMSKIPDDVFSEMLIAGAEIVEEAQKKKGRVYGVYLTGDTLSSIRHGKPRRTRSGRYIDVAPQGTDRDGNRNAEVAFVNEYGVKGRQKPRPFIRDANEEATPRVVDAQEEKFDDWLKKF